MEFNKHKINTLQNNKHEIYMFVKYRKGTSIRQVPVFRHLRALRKNPWKLINFMN